MKVPYIRCITCVCVCPADQVDVQLLRCQQLRLYILKAARALLAHQDKLRHILSQPAVLDLGPSTGGEALAPWWWGGGSVGPRA